MEGLSLGDCLRRSLKFGQSVLGSLQVSSLSKNLLDCQDWCPPLGCMGDNHVGYIQLFLF